MITPIWYFTAYIIDAVWLHMTVRDFCIMIGFMFAVDVTKSISAALHLP